MPTKASHSDLMQIGEVAERTGLSFRTIRHYDEIGLVVPSGHTTGGFRLYAPTDLERLRFVRRIKALEFSLDEVRELVRLLDVHVPNAADLDQIDGFITVIKRRQDELGVQLETARNMVDLLEQRRVIS